MTVASVQLLAVRAYCLRRPGPGLRLATLT